MKCKEFWELASSYLVDEECHDPEIQGSLEDHLKKCASCRREFETIKHGMRQLCEEVGEEMDPYFFMDIRKQVESGIKRPRQSRFSFNDLILWRPAWVGALVAVAAALFLVLGNFSSKTDFTSVEEITDFFDQSAFSGLYTVSLWDGSPALSGASNGDLMDPDLFRGVPESWSAVLEQVEQQG